MKWCGAVIKGKNATNLGNQIHFKHESLMSQLQVEQKKAAIGSGIANNISYISQMKEIGSDCGWSFWLDAATQCKFASMCELAQDFVAAQASQTCSERVFFVR